MYRLYCNSSIYQYLYKGFYTTKHFTRKQCKHKYIFNSSTLLLLTTATTVNSNTTTFLQLHNNKQCKATITYDKSDDNVNQYNINVQCNTTSQLHDTIVNIMIDGIRHDIEQQTGVSMNDITSTSYYIDSILSANELYNNNNNATITIEHLIDRRKLIVRYNNEQIIYTDSSLLINTLINYVTQLSKK